MDEPGITEPRLYNNLRCMVFELRCTVLHYSVLLRTGAILSFKVPVHRLQVMTATGVRYAGARFVRYLSAGVYANTGDYKQSVLCSVLNVHCVMQSEAMRSVRGLICFLYCHCNEVSQENVVSTQNRSCSNPSCRSATLIKTGLDFIFSYLKIVMESNDLGVNNSFFFGKPRIRIHAQISVNSVRCLTNF